MPLENCENFTVSKNLKRSMEISHFDMVQVTNHYVEQNAGNYDLNLGQATVWNLSKRNHANDQNFNNGDKFIVQSINKKSNNIVHSVTV